MLIRIEGFDLPGRTCGPGPGCPEGHDDVHVAVQGRKGQQDLLGLVSAGLTSTRWELDCDAVSGPPAHDLRGPQIQGSPRKRFIYLAWGDGAEPRSFAIFRRAKLWLDAVADDLMAAAVEDGVLLARLGLSDAKGMPLSGSVRPPRIEWSRAPTAARR